MLVVPGREPLNNSDFRCERAAGFRVSGFRLRHASMRFDFLLLAAIPCGTHTAPPAAGVAGAAGLAGAGGVAAGRSAIVRAGADVGAGMAGGEAEADAADAVDAADGRAGGCIASRAEAGAGAGARGSGSPDGSGAAGSSECSGAGMLLATVMGALAVPPLRRATRASRCWPMRSMPASASASSASISSGVAPVRSGMPISSVRDCPSTLNVTDWHSHMCSPSRSTCCRTSCLAFALSPPLPHAVPRCVVPFRTASRFPVVGLPHIICHATRGAAVSRAPIPTRRMLRRAAPARQHGSRRRWEWDGVE